MSNDITVFPFNAVYNNIHCDEGISADLNDYFSFDAPGSEWVIRKAQKKARELGMPVKYSNWDGKVRLFSKATHRMYAGLSSRLETFAKERDLNVEYSVDIEPVVFNKEDARDFIKTLNIPEKYAPREYQIDAFVEAVRNRRLILLSPTGSGKSLIIYLLLRYNLRFSDIKNVLIIVPTINLLSQMYNDFEDYGYDAEKNIRLVGGPNDRDTGLDKPIIISTWQSIYSLDKKYFLNFQMVICDEVHGADAKSIKGIMEKLTLCHYRFGFTGTLKETLCHRLVLEGLFGSVYVSSTTSELMKDKYLSDMEIKAITLEYSKESSKLVKNLDYAGEIDFLINHEKRNRFIVNLAKSMKGNTLVLFRMINHGQALYKELNGLGRPVYFIDGGVGGDEREQIRTILNEDDNAILVGSYGCVSTGVNIPTLKNIIFASPYKSRIKVLQSIGRGLRRTKDKQLIIVYDISDDLSYKKHQNFTLRHYVDRIQIYAEENFNYKTFRIKLE